MGKKSGTRVEVNLDSRTVRVLDSVGNVVARFEPPPAHVSTITFDPSDIQGGLSYNGRLPEEDQTPEGLARLAIQASLPSEGAVRELLGPAVTGLASDAAIDAENAVREAHRQRHDEVEKLRTEAEKAAEEAAKSEAKADTKAEAEAKVEA